MPPRSEMFPRINIRPCEGVAVLESQRSPVWSQSSGSVGAPEGGSAGLDFHWKMSHGV